MKENKRIVVVLGMHRSGTSLITSSLQIMGVELGDELIMRKPDNPKGFFEDNDVVNLNIEMLRQINSCATSLTPIQETDFNALHARGYYLRAAELIQKKTKNKEIFGIKDPRLTKLLPFWEKVFARCELDVSYILPIRNPLSVCHSVARRNQFVFELTYLLWLETVIKSLAGTVNKKRVLIDYDIFMDNPHEEVNRISSSLGLPVNQDLLQDFILNFIDKNLRHTKYEKEHVMLHDISCPLVYDVYSTLRSIIASNIRIDNKYLNNKISEWLLIFNSYSLPLRLVDIASGKRIPLNIIDSTEITETRSQLDQARQEVVKLQSQMSSKDEYLLKLQADKLSLENELNACREALAMAHIKLK